MSGIFIGEDNRLRLMSETSYNSPRTQEIGQAAVVTKQSISKDRHASFSRRITQMGWFNGNPPGHFVTDCNLPHRKEAEHYLQGTRRESSRRRSKRVNKQFENHKMMLTKRSRKRKFSLNLERENIMQHSMKSFAEMIVDSRASKHVV